MGTPGQPGLPMGVTMSKRKSWNKRDDHGRTFMGSVLDPECLENSMKPIGPVQCRNNCKYYKFDPQYKRRRCMLGYRNDKRVLKNG
jgi:hypothetical protein